MIVINVGPVGSQSLLQRLYLLPYGRASVLFVVVACIGIDGANRPEPGRRSVTWSSPSMLLDARQRPVLVLGTPGGRQVPSTIANVVARWALHGQPLEIAVRAGRFYLTAGELRLETPQLAGAMGQMGYDVVVTDEVARPSYGSVQALAIDWGAGRVSSFADERRSAGFVVGRG